LEPAICVVHELRRKILGRPTRQIDENIGFVQTDGERLVLPGPGGMGNNDRHVREIDRNIVKVIGLEYLWRRPPPPRMPVPMPEWPLWKITGACARRSLPKAGRPDGR